MPASARLAHIAELFAIWYQFVQYTPLVYASLHRDEAADAESAIVREDVAIHAAHL